MKGGGRLTPPPVQGWPKMLSLNRVKVHDKIQEEKDAENNIFAEW